MFSGKAPGNTSTSSLFGTPTPQQPGSTSGSSIFGTASTPPTSLFSTPSTSSQTGSSIFSTAVQPSSSIFGSTQTATATTPASANNTATNTTGGGLFGISPAASAPPHMGFFGTTPAAGTPNAPTPSLFGPAPPSSFASSSSTTAPGGGLFGTASTVPSGGLYGTQAASTTLGTGASSLFSGLGSATPAAHQTQQMQQTQQTQQPQQPHQTHQTMQPQQLQQLQQTQQTQQTQPQQTQQSQQSQQQKPSLFGTTYTSTTPTLGLFSINPSTTTNTTNTTINNQTSSQQPPPGGVKVDAYNLAGYHKYYELSDPIRIELEAAERYIYNEMQKCDNLSALFPEHRDMVSSVRSDAELMERKLMTTNSFLQSDAGALETLVKHQKEDDQHSSLSVRTIDLLRLPHASRIIQQQQQASAVASATGVLPGASPTAPGATGPQATAAETFGPLPTLSSTNTNESDITSNVAMINYFNRVWSEMEGRLQQFSESVSEVEASLRSVEVQAARKLALRGAAQEVTGAGGDGMDVDQGGRQDDVRRLNRALKEFYEAMSDTAVRMVDAKEGLREVKGGVEGRAQGANLGRSVRG